MRGEALHFETVTLQRMPGFETGGFAVAGLSRKVNVISGPNGSGKSTLARAMQAVLWKPEPGDREAAVTATATLGDARLQLELYAGRISALLDGQSIEPLPVPARRERYLLALPDLLIARDADFAQQVAIEATGGYRLAEAADQLGRRNVGRACQNERRALRQAEATIESLRREARESRQREEQELPQLQAELTAANQAAARADALQRVIRLREAVAEAAAAAEAYAAFEEPVRRLKGDEAEQLEELDKQLRQTSKDAESTRTEIDRSEAQLAAARLPAEGLSDEAWAPLKAAGQELVRLGRELQSATLLQAEATRVEAATRAAIAPGIEFEQLAELATDGLGDLDQWLRDGQRLTGLSESVSRAEAVFKVAEPADPAPLRTALDGLQRWVDAQGQPVPPALGCSFGLLLAALVAGWGLAPTRLDAGWGWGVFAAGGLLAIGLLWMSQRLRRPDPGQTWREAYAAAGQAPPAEWTLDAVTARAAELREAIAVACLEQRRHQVWEQLTALREEGDRLRESVAATQAALVERYGLDDSPLMLAQLHHRLNDWHAARVQALARTTVVETLQAQEAAQRGTLAAWLGELGWPPAESAAEAAEQLDTVRLRRESWQQATATLEAARRRLEQQTTELATRRQRVAELFTQLGLAPDDRPGLARALEQRPACEAARLDKEARDVALRVAQEAAPEGDPGPDEPTEALRAHRDEALALAARSPGLNEAVGALKQKLHDAERKVEVEAALAAEDQAWAQLAARRDEDADAVVADLLAEHLEAQFREVELPAVLGRAEAIFAELTRGRYRLKLAVASGEARFQATDLETDRIRELDQLSSGNRVQLLLAVRLASIEADEAGGPRPPLWLDEAMGTSDDARTQAIIDAVAAVAAAGRQVFYLTAQADEVAKWQRRHAATHCVDLAAVRALQEPAAILDHLAPPAAVPAPNGLSHLEYGHVLEVPGLDPWAGAEQAHLWYAVHDPALLHKLLETYGLSRWVRYAERVRTVGLAALAMPEQEHQLARLRIEILQALLTGWRQGRSKPVDADVVARSIFGRRQTLTAVLALASECTDAESFLERLPALDNVGRRAAQVMREFLSGEGYLGEGQPLSAEELTELGLAAATPALGNQVIRRADVAWLVARLPVD